MSYNLFIEHHTKLQGNKGNIGIGSGWEDDFTNILTFYLSCDSEALYSFCHLVLGEEYEKPLSIETQVGTIHGRPDIVINLSSGSQLIIECKVDASLQPNQLQRYLEIESKNGRNAYVALFCKSPISIPHEVTENRRYKSPVKGSHYFWTDLFKILPKPNKKGIGIDTYRLLFCNYMELIGFAPSSLKDNWYKLYEDASIDENKKVRKLFGQKLAGIRAWLAGQNYRVSAVSYSGLQAVPKNGQLDNSEIQHITIWPDRARKNLLPFEAGEKLNNEVLKIALIFDSPEIQDSVLAIYNAFPCPFNDIQGNLWWATKPYKFSKGKVRLEVVSNLDQFLKEESNIEKMITDACNNVMENLFAIIGTKKGK